MNCPKCSLNLRQERRTKAGYDFGICTDCNVVVFIEDKTNFDYKIKTRRLKYGKYKSGFNPSRR